MSPRRSALSGLRVHGVRSAAVLLLAALVFGSTTACEHGHCAPSGGMATCAVMNAAGCAKTPHCQWDKACVVLTGCQGASEATCKSLDYCTFQSNDCQQTADPCGVLAVDNCGADKRCGVSMACRGTPVSCDTYDDEDACEADVHCDWSSSPAF